MRVSHVPGTLKNFARTPWRFQQTFVTPLKQLKEFTTIICGSIPGLSAGSVVIDEVVFPANDLEDLLRKQRLASSLARDASLVGETADEVQQLLAATLAGWVDFLFTPTPKPFTLYADHDENSTFFAATRSHLNHVTLPLSEAGFRTVGNYTRRL